MDKGKSPPARGRGQKGKPDNEKSEGPPPTDPLCAFMRPPQFFSTKLGAGGGVVDRRMANRMCGGEIGGVKGEGAFYR